jgi:hypothetical protein
MRHSWIGVAALCCLLAACGDHSDGHVTVINSTIGGLSNGSIHLGNGDVTVRMSHAPDAVITANGDLRIAQHPIAVDATQRQALKAYYGNAMAILTDGIATGKAGAVVGEEAAKSVVTRLASGNPDKIREDIDAKVKPLKEAALKICDDVGKVKQSQDQLAATLPAFKPYGNVISGDDVEDCKKDNDD